MKATKLNMDKIAAVVKAENQTFEKEFSCSLSTVDLSGWGGGKIKIRHKPKAVPKKVKPAISALACNEDDAGRTLEEHNVMVAYYRDLYENNKYPISGGDLLPEDRRCKDAAVGYQLPPISKRKNGSRQDNGEGMALLTESFMAWGKANDIDPLDM